MEKETKKVEDTTEDVDETTETNEETEQDADLSEDQESEEEKGEEESGDETEDSEGSDEDVDYKSELDKALHALKKSEDSRAKAEDKILKLKNKARKQKTGQEQSDDEKNKDEDDDIDTRIESRVNKALLDFMSDSVDEAIGKYTKNENEIALIKHHLEHTTPPQGKTRKDIVDAVENAWLISNKRRFRNISKVIKQKAKSEKTSTKPSSGSGTPPTASPKVTAYDRQMANQFFHGDVKKWLKFKPK